MKCKDTVVESVKDYLSWLENVTVSTVPSDSGEEIEFEQPMMYYRGQACKCWSLEPGVFRKPFSAGIVEHELLHKASLHLWKELSPYSTYLEKMVFLQHYGMKTRLLDVTFNPLVALFFACENTDCHSDGAVYCGDQQSIGNERIAELTSEYIFKYTFDDFGNDVKAFITENGEIIGKFICPIFVFPPINNPRIEHQNGAFIMPPLLKKTDVLYNPNSESLNDSGFFNEERVLIPDSCKAKIVHDLHRFGINRGTIFQDITEKIETIVQEERWTLGRFNIDIKSPDCK